LAALNRELRWIFRHAKRAGNTAGTGLANVARNALNLRVVKSLYADFVICADEFPGRSDAADFFGLSRGR
jgi:hypothetical protein